VSYERSNKLKKSFTLIELIIVIVVLALISVGSFKAIEMLYQRYYQVNTITKFSILSQTTLDSIGSLFYYRIPSTAIGYDPDSGEFKKLSEVDDKKYTVFEVITDAFMAKQHIGDDSQKGYSGFIDLDASDKDNKILVCKDFDIDDTNDTLNNFFNKNDKKDLNETVAIIFAGGLDEGDSEDDNDSFGWHGHDHNKTFLIKKFTKDGNDANLTMTDDIEGNKIYAKYYLVSSAWAIARGKDIDQDADCLKGLNVDDNTLLLFYNYRPWNKETFCADKHTGSDVNISSGQASILAQNITSFRVKEVNSHLELRIQFEKALFKGSEHNITITKQKVTF